MQVSRRTSLRALTTLVVIAAAFACFRAVPRAEQAPRARVPQRLHALAAERGRVRVIVGLRTAQRASLRARQDDVLARLPQSETRAARRFRTIPYFAAAVSAATLAQLESDPDVETIEEDAAERVSLMESVPLIGGTAVWTSGDTGEGWNVAVLDTGVDSTHPFLAGKVIAEACYSDAGGDADGISLCPGGASSSTDAGSALNCSGFFACEHGTHVAGIAAGRGADFSGVAKDAGVIAVQVFTGFPAGVECGASPCVLSFTSDQILGLERVLALSSTYRIAAVNMSLGGAQKFTDSTSCDAANASRKAVIDNLRAAGIAVVVAAGNSGYTDGLAAPACISSAISVGASTKQDGIASFSNASPLLDLLAPGLSIYSSVPGGFAYLSGTSMAAPHVAGAWALVKAHRPSATVDDVLGALRRTGRGIVDTRSIAAPSYPRVEVDAAVNGLAATRITIDTPRASAVVNGSFAIAGWAIDSAAQSGSGVDAVHVYATPLGGGSATFLGAAAYGGVRPDVGAAFGAPFTDSAFELTASLTPGTYQIVAYAHSSVTNTFNAAASALIGVDAPRALPAGAVDAPAAGATVDPTFLVAGWSADLGASTGTGVDAVHVWALPGDSRSAVFLGAATIGVPRADVGAAFGSPFAASGYSLVASLAPGPYTLIVYSRSTISGTFTPITRAITVRAPGRPVISIDAPGPDAAVGQPFLVGGWAADLDSAAGAGVDAVHVWAIPSNGGNALFAGAATLGGRRDDVAAALGGQFGPSGYNLVISSLPAGNYQLVVYAHSTVTGAFASRVVSITIR